MEKEKLSTYQKIRNLILRLIVSPLVFLLIIIKWNYFGIEMTIHFIIYGGEWVNFDREDKNTIRNILEEFKSKHPNR